MRDREVLVAHACALWYSGQVHLLVQKQGLMYNITNKPITFHCVDDKDHLPIPGIDLPLM